MAQTLDTAADSFDPISHLMAPVSRSSHNLGGIRPQTRPASANLARPDHVDEPGREDPARGGRVKLRIALPTCEKTTSENPRPAILAPRRGCVAARRTS